MAKQMTVVGLAILLAGLAGCAQIERLENQNSRLRTQLQSLQGERQALLDENQVLKADRETLQASLLDAKRVGQRMSELVGQMQGERDRLQRQTQELKALLDEFGDFTVEMRGEGNFIVMQSEVLFDPGKTELTSTAQASLDQVARYLLAHPNQTVRIDGHTDAVPITHSVWKDNYHLAAMRAHAVMGYLAGAGVSADRMFIAGFGPNRPLVPVEEPAQDMPANRRVEILLVPEGARSISEILEGFEE